MRLLIAVLSLILVVSFAAPAVVDTVSDDEIRDTLMVKLAGDRDVRGTQIEVEAKDGVVTLGGQVFNEKAKKRAEKMSKKHKGVKQVVNNLTVAP
jgi:osmotically-inducible protein OsmY